MLFQSDHEPTEAEIDQMYEDYMKQFGDTEEEQLWNYQLSFEMHIS